MQRLYPRTLIKPTVRTMLVPVPKAGTRAGSRDHGSGRSSASSGSVTPIGAPSMRDGELLAGARTWSSAIFGEELAGQTAGERPAGD